MHAVETSFSFMEMMWRVESETASVRQWPNVYCFVRTLRTYIRQIIRTDIRWGNWPLFVL